MKNDYCSQNGYSSDGLFAIPAFINESLCDEKGKWSISSPRTTDKNCYVTLYFRNELFSERRNEE